MTVRPVIVYIDADDNPFRDALAYFLTEHCGCDVIVYESIYDFEDNFRHVEILARRSALILVMVKQDEYNDQHLRVITKVRCNLSADLPIVVIPAGWEEERFTGITDDSQVFAYNYLSPELTSLVKQLVVDFQPPKDYFGAETKKEQAMLLQQLETAYRKNYLSNNDEEMLAVPSHNDQIVAEAIRLQLLPPELIKIEFDETLKEAPREFSQVAVSLYEQESAKIREMNKEERKEFCRYLFWVMGQEIRDDGSVYVIRPYFGDDIHGFAIDPVTLEYCITTRFGKHSLAKQNLAARIEAIECLRRKLTFFELPENIKLECLWRLMGGLIFQKVEGFSMPILMLRKEDADAAAVKKVASFLKRQKKFLPVTSEGILLEG